MRNVPTLSLEICQYPLKASFRISTNVLPMHPPPIIVAEHFHQELYFEPKAQGGHKRQYCPHSAEVHFSSSGNTNGDFNLPSEPSSLGKTDSQLTSRDKESPISLVCSILPLHMVYIYAAHMQWTKNSHTLLTHLSLGRQDLFPLFETLGCPVTSLTNGIQQNWCHTKSQVSF